MASAGIDISITGNASAFLASLRAAEDATRQVSNAAEAAAAREEAAYRRAAAEAAGRARAQVEAARAVQRAEREAAAAAAAAARQGTEAARAEARAKSQALAAARAAAAAAQQQAAAALAAAQAQQRAMGAASRAAIDAAEAYRRAADAAAAAAAAAGRNQPPGGGGNPPPPGGGPPPPGGGRRGGRGGGGGPPPPPPRRGGTSGGMDANMAYQIIQDTWQGGFAGVANQIPQLLGLLGKYGKVLAGIGGVLTVGVGLGKAIADPGGFLESMKGFTDVIDAMKGAILRPEKTRATLEEWLASFEENTKTAKAMDDRLKAFNTARDLAQAKQRGAATGSNAEGLANAARIGAEGRAGILDRNLSAREQANELERVRIEGIQNEQVQRKAMAEFEAKAAMDQALIRKKAAEEEFAIRERENKAAQQALNELEARAKKAKLPDGVTGTTKELTEIDEARKGVEGRANSAKAALQEAGKAVTEAAAGEQAAAFQADLEKRRIANEQAARDAEQARQESIRRFKKFWNDFEDIVKTGVQNAQNAAAQAANKKEFTESLEELQLRARGRHRAADKLKKEREVQKEAKEYQAATGSTPEQARAYAEQKYDATHSNGRIRGAGYRSGKEPPVPFSLDNPGFRKLGVDAPGVVPGGIPNLDGGQPPMPGQGTSRPAWGGSDGKGGLDGLDQMQKRNRRIRGAGFKDKDPGAGDVAGAAASAAVGAAAGGGVGALASVIISKLSSIQATLERSTPGKQTRTR